MRCYYNVISRRVGRRSTLWLAHHSPASIVLILPSIPSPHPDKALETRPGRRLKVTAVKKKHPPGFWRGNIRACRYCSEKRKEVGQRPTLRLVISDRSEQEVVKSLYWQVSANILTGLFIVVINYLFCYPG
jgi:hypothetical protein